MATERQKEAARRNIGKARQAQSARAQGKDVPRQGQGMSTAEKDDLADREFAFPKERKEPLTDARHVRNAIARFDQVEGVSDAERDQAWKRIVAAAKRYDVEVSESGWRDLAEGGKDRAALPSAAAGHRASTETPAATLAGPNRSWCSPVAFWNRSPPPADHAFGRAVCG